MSQWWTGGWGSACNWAAGCMHERAAYVSTRNHTTGHHFSLSDPSSLSLSSFFFVQLLSLINSHQPCDWACSPMVGRSSGTLLTRVQILVLAPFPGFFRIYRRYALNGKRRSRRRRGAIGDFGNLQNCRCSVLRRCVRVFIGVSVRARCERLRCTVSFSKL
jgi:hypothetical protein